MLDETSGTNANNSISARDATYEGTFTLAASPGIFGHNAVDLSSGGSPSGNVDVADNAAFSPQAGASGQITICHMARFHEIPVGYMVAKGSGGAFEWASVGGPTTTYAPVVWQSDGTPCMGFTTNNAVFAVDTDYFIVLRFNRATPVLAAYINNSKEGPTGTNTESTSAAGNSSDGGAELTMGRRGDSGASLNGLLAGVAIFPTALSEGDISDLYDAVILGPGPPVFPSGIPKRRYGYPRHLMRKAR